MSAASVGGAGPVAAGGPAQLANVHATGTAAPAAGASAGQSTQAGQAAASTDSALQDHQQIHDMLGEIDPGLQLNQMLKMLVAAMILQALAGQNDSQDNPAAATAAAALTSASAGASLAALSHTTSHMTLAHASNHALQPERAVHATPYAQATQPTARPQGQLDLSA
jgi:hypothetical protein